MGNLTLVFSFLMLVLVELGYFSLARRFGIVDRPNDRTLHEIPTIRGGGVIFYIAVVFYFIISGGLDIWFLIGLSLVSAVGLLDDIFNLKSSIRFILQVAAFWLLFWGLGWLSLGFLILLIASVVVVAALNAYNFMDGVNGMTGAYSLVTLGSLIIINQYHVKFVDNNFLILIVLSLIIFNFFNFRKKAVCFAGDVGSYSIAFIVIYLILMVSIKTGNFIFILFLAVYGVDTALTIVHRLLRKENIFKPHRLHLFQVLVYHYRISHLGIAGIYAFTQLLINGLLFACLGFGHSTQYIVGLVILFLLVSVYLYWKVKIFSEIQGV